MAWRLLYGGQECSEAFLGAAGLENEPDDLLAPDRCTCEIFRGGWIPRVGAAAAAASEAFQKRMCEAEK
ncbi:MAG: hypothetical protein J1F63_03335 [Oscillospiraceae bacterium]|nr:hypothetical protein [Oscillospiraceae bacterium]